MQVISLRRMRSTHLDGRSSLFGSSLVVTFSVVVDATTIDTISSEVSFDFVAILLVLYFGSGILGLDWL